MLYGGAAGGGKTDALIANQLRWVEHPKHRGIILRRTRPQLQEVIDRTQELYPDIVPGAKWNERESRWNFPSGAVVQMGYAEHEDDIRQFKSFEYNLIEFDELTSFTEFQYTFMFSRNRSKSIDLPAIMRAASNPGDIGHAWVFNRFVKGREPYKVYTETMTVGKTELSITRQLVPARVWDNPKIPNRDGYIAGLLQMGEEGLMYLYGSWTGLSAAMFKQLPETVAPNRDLRNLDYYVVRTLDYGLVDVTAVYWLIVYNTLPFIDIIGELYVNELSLDSLAAAIKQKEAELQIRIPMYSVADPSIFAREGSSMQSISSILQQKGLWFEKANNDRVAGWAQILRYIYQKKLRVWNDRAPNLIRTLPLLQRDPRHQNDIKDHQEDHAADSLRYGLMAIWEQKGRIDTKAIEPDPTKQDTVFDKMQQDFANPRGEYLPGLGYW